MTTRNTILDSTQGKTFELFDTFKETHPQLTAQRVASIKRRVQKILERGLNCVDNKTTIEYFIYEIREQVNQCNEIWNGNSNETPQFLKIIDSLSILENQFSTLIEFSIYPDRQELEDVINNLSKKIEIFLSEFPDKQEEQNEEIIQNKHLRKFNKSFLKILTYIENNLDNFSQRQINEIGATLRIITVTRDIDRLDEVMNTLRKRLEKKWKNSSIIIKIVNILSSNRYLSKALQSKQDQINEEDLLKVIKELKIRSSELLEKLPIHDNKSTKSTLDNLSSQEEITIEYKFKEQTINQLSLV